MPELPEVETVTRTLRELVKGKQITSVQVYLPRIIQRPADIEQFCDALVGHTILDVTRRGKFIRFLLDGLVLVSHLRMEGRYGVYEQHEEIEKHTHVVFTFNDGTQLRYKDVRQFGTMHLFSEGEDLNELPLRKLGIEPLSEQFTAKVLREKLQHRHTKIKPLLLNQELIVGLGNIYVDEALFAARIHPERSPSSLSKAEWSKLHKAIVDTLTSAVEAGGSSIKSYVNGQGEMGMFQQQLLAYGRENQPCTSCGTLLTKFVVGGRGTHICPRCQKMKS